MEFVVLWIICGGVAAFVASARGGNGGLGFVAGVLLGPLGIVLAFFMGSEAGRVASQVSSGQAKRCPMCAEAVLVDAVICKHCGHDFYAEFKDKGE